MNNIKQQIKDIIKTGDFGQYLPEFLYHATFSGTLDSIKKNGLGSLKSGYKSLWNLQYEQGVYLDTDASSAESFVEGSDDDRLDTESVVVFKIPTAKLDHSLLEVDWNNTWNTDIIEDGEFESLKDYFDSITYFYGGVIPFADLAMIESLNEEQEDDIELEPIAPTKENIIKLLSDYKNPYLISTKNIGSVPSNYTYFYLLPNGTFIININNPTYRKHSFVDEFLALAGITIPPTTERSTFFEEITDAIAIRDGGNNHLTTINLGKVEPTQSQYQQLNEYLDEIDYNKVAVMPHTKKGNKVDMYVFPTQETISGIKRYYKTGKLQESNNNEEDINHREVYKSLTFSDNPERGPIFISREGKFANIGRFVTHAKIFDGQDYEGDDYYVLHDAFDLIKANGGNRFEPFAYIDLWSTPNPAQKKAIITWMYYLLEWNMFKLQVNTSQNNETYNLLEMIPEDVYRDIIRNL